MLMNTHALMRRPAEEDQDYLTRAQQRLAMHLPGLFRVLDAGEDEHGPFAVCEWLNGELLESVLARGPLSLSDYAHFSLQVLDTLASLHDSGWCARSLGAHEVILVPPSPGGMPVFKLLSKIIPTGMEDVAMRRSGMHDFGKLSWQALVGRDFVTSEPDIAGKLEQKRPDLPSGVIKALATLLQSDETSRPTSAREVRQIMETALAAQIQPSAAWQPPPMMYAPMVIQPPAWQPTPETPPTPVEMPQNLAAPSPAPASNAPKAKPITAPGSQTQSLAKKPVPATTSSPSKNVTPPVPAGKSVESASPRPFPWGPLIGGTITLILAFFMGRIFILPIWERWREDAARQESQGKEFRPTTPATPPAPASKLPAETKKAAPPKQGSKKKTGESEARARIIDAKDIEGVKKQMRQFVTISGTPLKATESKDKRQLYLWFGEQGDDAVYLTLEKKVVKDATLAILEAMVGKKVTASGQVSHYQGKPQVKVFKLTNIKAE
jgi:hypothetical protein